MSWQYIALLAAAVWLSCGVVTLVIVKIYQRPDVAADQIRPGMVTLIFLFGPFGLWLEVLAQRQRRRRRQHNW